MVSKARATAETSKTELSMFFLRTSLADLRFGSMAFGKPQLQRLIVLKKRMKTILFFQKHTRDRKQVVQREEKQTFFSSTPAKIANSISNKVSSHVDIFESILRSGSRELVVRTTTTNPIDMAGRTVKWVTDDFAEGVTYSEEKCQICGPPLAGCHEENCSNTLTFCYDKTFLSFVVWC
ncbi:hypothetical protein NPIL_341751 [Nephila pilipes]|uniref:Uncharacterized protein n=1 Tax=Nephila pilipes TaxID=299642 RepID=A0A8X6KDQ9_NEPPI|nr:hypothetical protein NPIL_341751 [Nephila pilipes]